MLNLDGKDPLELCSISPSLLEKSKLDSKKLLPLKKMLNSPLDQKRPSLNLRKILKECRLGYLLLDSKKLRLLPLLLNHLQLEIPI